MTIRRFTSLLIKSGLIEEQIRKESRAGGNWLRLLKLQQIKLHIKERLQNMARTEGAYQTNYAFAPIRHR